MDQRYRPQLDGVRAFCIIFTIFNHIRTTPSFIDGSVGVDVFFPLSGWLITWLLLEERTRIGATDLRGFYIRRVFRIVPLYYLTIAIYAVAALSLYAATGVTGKIGELHNALLYLISFNSEYRSVDAGVLFGHAWTLGIEEKFYAIWPALILLFARSRLVLGLSAAAVCIVLMVLFGYNDFLARGYFGLGVGAALAFHLNSAPAKIEFLRKRSLGGVAFLFMVAAYVGLIAAPHVAWHLAISASAAVMIASVWFCQEQPLARFLRLAPLAWLGTLTYAIYLLQSLAINVGQALVQKLHLPDNALLIFLASYPICVAAAWLAHKSVERPLIDTGRDLAKRLRPSMGAA